MPTYNENIEIFKCYVRASHLTKDEKDNNTFHKAYAFAIQSVAGKFGIVSPKMFVLLPTIIFMKKDVKLY
jgi:hypothetical protein